MNKSTAKHNIYALMVTAWVFGIAGIIGCVVISFIVSSISTLMFVLIAFCIFVFIVLVEFCLAFLYALFGIREQLEIMNEK